MSPSEDSQPSEKAKGKSNESPRKPVTIVPKTSIEPSTSSNDDTSDEPVVKRLKFAEPIDNAQDDKPPMGSEKWKEMKRASHSKVERKRRDNITECINELAKLVPTEKRQKEATLRAAVHFIKNAKEQQDANVRKWTLDKLVADQTIRQLQDEMDNYKNKYDSLRATLKKMGHGDLCPSDDEPS
ncbi:hypothetical protein BC941DRAFT_436655 [Chlamydoabsidia padenii]|nr:hypothetical protein BC941DRAFT_436655 [Chlamydoabsidia padenii]